MATMAAVSLAFMTLRLVCKGRNGRMFGWDDYTLAFPWACLLVYAALTIVSCKYDIGGHVYDASPDELKIGVKLRYIGEFFAIIAVAISKTSFAIILLRLSTERWHMQLLWFIILSLNFIMWICGPFLLFSVRLLRSFGIFASLAAAGILMSQPITQYSANLTALTKASSASSMSPIFRRISPFCNHACQPFGANLMAVSASLSARSRRGGVVNVCTKDRLKKPHRTSQSPP
ncbi:hypothetical protein F5884DRAFT_757460 [Xylogone sp. PMI_703]|nr:hypothetical protein F5884DRAFT_757460 [Xylogone sp. PMI_703]